MAPPSATSVPGHGWKNTVPASSQTNSATASGTSHPAGCSEEHHNVQGDSVSYVSPSIQTQILGMCCRRKKENMALSPLQTLRIQNAEAEIEAQEGQGSPWQLAAGMAPHAPLLAGLGQSQHWVHRWWEQGDSGTGTSSSTRWSTAQQHSSPSLPARKKPEGSPTMTQQDVNRGDI